jgi:hypothetical protein
MKKSKQLMCGDFKVLRYAIRRTGVPGEWIKVDDYRQFRAETGAIVNYWPTTGTINFQGPKSAADELRSMVLKRAIITK